MKISKSIFIILFCCILFLLLSCSSPEPPVETVVSTITPTPETTSEPVSTPKPTPDSSIYILDGKLNLEDKVTIGIPSSWQHNSVQNDYYYYAPKDNTLEMLHFHFVENFSDADFDEFTDESTIDLSYAVFIDAATGGTYEEITPFQIGNYRAARYNHEMQVSESVNATLDSFVVGFGSDVLAVNFGVESGEITDEHLQFMESIIDSVEIIQQSSNITEPSVESSTDTTGATTGMTNALGSARDYLDFMSFSREGLIGQLEYEGFTTEEAEYAVDNITVDWNEQAVGSANSYLDFTPFSQQGLISQLEFEGFTSDQAMYAIDNITVDWNEQAVKSAISYLDFTSFSRQGLIEQLEYEGFTNEQAIYGVNNCGADW